MDTLGVIPVRLSSLRLPNKPLADIDGLSLVQRVWIQAKRSTELTNVVIATEDDEIVTEAKKFGAEVVKNEPGLISGSSRVAALKNLHKYSEYKYYLNVQGDMPFISPNVIDKLIVFLKNSDFDMATVGIPILDLESHQREHTVKIAVTNQGQALYFSRAQIPFPRAGKKFKHPFYEEDIWGFRHIGLYAFRSTALKVFESTAENYLESVEKLEQLRLLTEGYRVGVCIINPQEADGFVEVDTQEDLDLANKLAKEAKL